MKMFLAYLLVFLLAAIINFSLSYLLFNESLMNSFIGSFCGAILAVAGIQLLTYVANKKLKAIR